MCNYAKQGVTETDKASKDECLENVIALGWQLYLCSSPPYLIQTKHDLRMHEYTELAFAGDAEGAHSREEINPANSRGLPPPA